MDADIRAKKIPVLVVGVLGEKVQRAIAYRCESAR